MPSEQFHPTNIQPVKSCFLQLSELFVAFEEKPRGAASLAQVHKAVLHDGRTVAVKVQHPKVQRQSTKDIMVMEVREFHCLDHKRRLEMFGVQVFTPHSVCCGSVEPKCRTLEKTVASLCIQLKITL